MNNIKTPEECRDAATRVSALLFQEGFRGVVVAVSGVMRERGGETSAYYVSLCGPCLELEGLGRRVTDTIDHLWRTASQPPQPVASGGKSTTHGHQMGYEWPKDSNGKLVGPGGGKGPPQSATGGNGTLGSAGGGDGT